MPNHEKIDVLLPDGSKQALSEMATHINVKPSELYRRIMLAAIQGSSGQNSKWHSKLEEILNSNDEKTIDAVTQNIDVFHERLRPSRKRKAG